MRIKNYKKNLQANKINLIKPIIVNGKTFNLSLSWILGFWQGDGSQTIYLKPNQNHSTGKQICLIWEIHQNVIDKELLLAISIFLASFISESFNTNPIIVTWDGKPVKGSIFNGVGVIEISSKKGDLVKEMWRLRIYTQGDILNVLLPILMTVKANLVLKKRAADLDLFIEACSIVQKGQHRSVDGNTKIANLSSKLSNKLGWEDKLKLPDISNNLDNQNVVGITDSEGCFSISLTHGIRFVFNISQLMVEELFLNRLIAFFGAGRVHEQKIANSDNVAGSFIISDKKDIENIVIPFFAENELQTLKKKASFEKFREAFLIDKDPKLTTATKITKIKTILSDQI